jgi:hypothetical protein
MKIKDKVKEDFNAMSTYEKYKLVVDFMRFCATMLAPLMIIVMGHFAKVYLQW